MHRASVEVAAGREPEILREVIARPLLGLVAFLTIALLVHAVLQPGKQERQPLAEMADDNPEIWIDVEQPAEHQAHGVAGRLITKTQAEPTSSG